MEYTQVKNEGWRTIGNSDDWQCLDETLLGGEDGVIKEVHFSHGEYVDSNLQMIYSGSPRIWILIQMQNTTIPSIEFLCEGIVAFEVFPNQELEMSIHFENEETILYLASTNIHENKHLISKVVCKSVFYRVPDPPLFGGERCGL